jgi:hypothetical protein
LLQSGTIILNIQYIKSQIMTGSTKWMKLPAFKSMAAQTNEATTFLAHLRGQLRQRIDIISRLNLKEQIRSEFGWRWGVLSRRLTLAHQVPMMKLPIWVGMRAFGVLRILAKQSREFFLLVIWVTVHQADCLQ